MLSIDNLRIQFHHREKPAVDGISFSMQKGEILGLVGESGSGKTVTTMAVAGLLDRSKAVCSGSILLDGKDLLLCSEAEWLPLRGKEIGVIFQEPMSALDPLQRIGKQVEEALRVHTKLSPAERKAKALAALADVELHDPERVYRSYPHELSGGMLQRVCVAAALITEPKLLIADEPTTALDVTVQAQLLTLLRRIHDTHGTNILFISHNLEVVRRLCDRVVVMQKGHIVESGETETIFHHPQQDYTKQLIAAIPRRTQKGAER